MDLQSEKKSKHFNLNLYFYVFYLIDGPFQST